MAARDFIHHRTFPGTTGNIFDVVLHIADFVESLPAFVFAAVLLGIACLPLLAVSFSPPLILLYLFFLGDWALLAALPRAQKSFGPAKPPTLLLAAMRLPFAGLPWPLALAAQIAGTGLVIYGFWIEPHRLTLTRQRLCSPKLKPGASLRLLHIGDLHVERITSRERQVIALARSTAPDAILFSGDFLNLSYLRDPQAWEAVRAVLGELSAPLGVFAVSGSPAVDLPDVVPQLLDGLAHIRWLRDEKVTIEHGGNAYDIVGLNCTHKPFEDEPRLFSVLGQSRPPRPLDRFTILLYHSPDLAPEAAQAGVDLQLSGHTHGGQVRLPLYGALYAGSLYGKKYESGRIQEGKMTLYVTRGVGMEGKGAPRVRCLCPPEITAWEITT